MRHRHTVSTSACLPGEEEKTDQVGNAETGGPGPARHLALGDAEPAVCLLGPQVVGAERNRRSASPAGTQHAAGLGDRPARIVEIMQHLVDDDEIGMEHAAVQIGDVAEPNLRVPDISRDQLGAGDPSISRLASMPMPRR